MIFLVYTLPPDPVQVTRFVKNIYLIKFSRTCVKLEKKEHHKDLSFLEMVN